ncbi:CapA family protein [Paludifilum halophilum]|uniref:Capsule synthesis protein CapA domain-containing protein n=1 Tax=Paludifilum halophilum TaxID=1642702 RepID=A0A235BCK3_9BACL|nr:CapA family protein [Paludifilum halophilum]OYD09932.1 hypothetical protein CHM34_02865 [Paludifilum halophilum]
MERLNRKERLLRRIKRHKKKAGIHTSAAFLLCVAAIVLINVLNPGSTANSQPSDEDHLLTLSVVGDMMFGRHVKKAVDRYGYEHPLDKVKPLLRSSDLVTGNFEHPILLEPPEKYPVFDKSIRLHTEKEAAKALKEAGFTSINLANNHTMDYGGPGLADTKKTFDEVGLETVGAGRDRYQAKQVAYQEVNGLNVATLGVTDRYPKGFSVKQSSPGVLPATPKTALPLVESAAKNSDLVVVHIHWGVEYDNNVHPRQRVFAQALVDAGADIVVGHHPHVLEPVEFYKGSVILYSTGNFIFDQGWSRTRETAVFQYKLSKDGKARLEIHPMLIREGQPRPLDGKLNVYRREKIYMQLTSDIMSSEAWNQKWKREGPKLVHEWDPKVLKKKQRGSGQE